jgi:hypothetical protein
MTCRPPGELFGRANELARLHTSLDDAMTGRLRVVLCSGKPGIGLFTYDDATRARLLAWLAQAAAYCGYYDEADVASAQALSLADGAQDPDLTIGVLSSRQLARSGPDHVVELASLGANDRRRNRLAAAGGGDVGSSAVDRHLLVRRVAG